mmetsp:Transcript_19024/g.54573  ORF Transcript_19024/g.54573 Transcript_19024/m.54573 type:complete len:302 (+) Transcript_19024:67-972(+)
MALESPYPAATTPPPAYALPTKSKLFHIHIDALERRSEPGVPMACDLRSPQAQLHRRSSPAPGTGACRASAAHETSMNSFPAGQDPARQAPWASVPPSSEHQHHMQQRWASTLAVESATLAHATVSSRASSPADPASPRQSAGSEDTTRTTIMLRNLPRALTRDHLVQLIHDEGFFGEVDFVYLPVDFPSGANTGYAFVNLTSHAAALRLWLHLSRFKRWGLRRRCCACRVSWAQPNQQGLAANVTRYRNSSVMHKCVPEAEKPLLLVQGFPASFPRPTKRIWPPHPDFGAHAQAPGRTCG